MPQWTRLRPERAEHRAKDAKRQTSPNPTPKPATEFSAISYAETQPDTQPISSPGGVRESVVSLSAAGDALNDQNHVEQPKQSREIADLGLRPPKRFSMLGFRHASDSQLAKTARLHAEAAPSPPYFGPPSIITTAPTFEAADLQKRAQFTFRRRSRMDLPAETATQRHNQSPPIPNGVEGPSNTPPQRVTFDPASKLRNTIAAPPAYGDVSSSSLALPLNRLSESSKSSKSDGSSGEHGIYASTTTTTHTIRTTTTLFRLPRRKRDKGPLFPLPQKVHSADASASSTPRLSNAGRPSGSPVRHSFYPAQPSNLGDSPRLSGQHSPITSHVLRTDSRASSRSRKSMPRRTDGRGRSSTYGSLRHAAVESDTPPLPNQSTRTSTSTAGRPSLAGLFNLSRLRQPSEPLSRSGTNLASPATPGSMTSHKNSFTTSREPAPVIPDREEGETPAKYLARLEAVLKRSALILFLTKSEDEFLKNVMRSYMRRFKFFEEPLDMALRKLLLHVDLPKEAQQIDRTLQSFAGRYHECNPGVFTSVDETYFITFSLLILHTDIFNKSNKHKMTRDDYITNTRGQGFSKEVLDCFYDNISYTPFIHVEDDLDVAGNQLILQKSSRKVKAPSKDPARKTSTGPLDPYILIFDNRLDILRSDEVGELQYELDPFNFLATATFDFKEAQKAFFKYGNIQIVSSRSRPEAFATAATIQNPNESAQGVVNIKVTKAGLLWRKDPKKRKTRSPWQEWGAVLTSSQLYFFRNPTWVKSLMSQHEIHQRHGRGTLPVTFKPPIANLKPDFMLGMDDVVALVDSSYKKHKNAFILAQRAEFREVFLADNESELNDWLAKLNFAATYRTVGVRMRNLIVGSGESQIRPESREADDLRSENGAPLTPDRLASFSRPEDEFNKQLMAARLQVMTQRLQEGTEKLETLEKQIQNKFRISRQFKVLAPIQQRTRDEILMAAKDLVWDIRWTQIQAWRVRCHRHILQIDLDMDKPAPPVEIRDEERLSQKISSPSAKSDAGGARGALSRLSSKTSNATSTNMRPSILGAGSKLFSMDEVFRSSSRTKAHQHRPKTSWELPHLDFDVHRRQSDTSPTRVPSSQAGNSEAMTEESRPETVEEPEAVDPSLSELSLKVLPTDMASATSTMATPSRQPTQDEHELLVEAGLIQPDKTPKDKKKSADSAADADQPRQHRVQDSEAGDSLSKVRHSLHKKLHNAHVPHHARGSKRGKGSESSAVMTEDGASITTEPASASETLTRAKGSFNVHGKKASVVTFGSEWKSDLTAEERLRKRKRALDEQNKAAGTPEVEDATLLSDASRRPVTPAGDQSEVEGEGDDDGDEGDDDDDNEGRNVETPEDRPGTAVTESTITTLERSGDAQEAEEQLERDTQKENGQLPPSPRPLHSQREAEPSEKSPLEGFQEAPEPEPVAA